MIIKCKMCGGDIQFNPGDTNGQCDHCGCTTTFPKLPDEQRANLFNRANHFRRQCEFDKAMAAYEHILEEDDTDAEAHWGVVLSKYGIEYVEDPVTHERIPTCHRAQVISILSDEDYQNALKYAPDTYSREIYEKEAKRIAEIQKGILAISSQEKPYDVFICYKETDNSGSRTKDSTLAQEIYYQLINEGYKVFFSRITLEDKLGQEYEPYIFAALNSAKVMLVVGTKPEFFNAVWVKNEWSRYLALMKNDRKRVLIPCYRDMDPYDLPEELSSLQSQDMSKIGFMQDIIHGVKKVLGADKQSPTNVTVQAAGPGVASLHKRAVLFLEDNDWDSATEYFDRILDIDPEFAPAYIGKVQVKNKVGREADLARCKEPISTDPDFQKAVRFADEKQRAIYNGYNRAIVDRIDLEQKESIYREAVALENRAAVEADFLAAAQKYDGAGDIRDAKERAANCRAKAASAKAEAEKAAAVFKEQIERERKERARQEEERRLAEERQRVEEAERQRKEEALRKEKKKRIHRICSAVAALVILIAGGYVVYDKVIQPKMKYDQAQALLTNGKLDEAYAAFKDMLDYGDSETKIREINYLKAEKLLTEGKVNEARRYYELAAEYSNAGQRVKSINTYIAAEIDFQRNDLVSAGKRYHELGEFLDAPSKYETVAGELYAQAKQALEGEDYKRAFSLLTTLGDYSDCPALMAEIDTEYESALDLWKNGEKLQAEQGLQSLVGWRDAEEKLAALRLEIADDAAMNEDYDTALAYYGKLPGTEEIESKRAKAVQGQNYTEAATALRAGELETAYTKFAAAGEYKDAVKQASTLASYNQANSLLAEGKYQDARKAYIKLGTYLDSEAKLTSCNDAIYQEATELKNQGDYAKAYELFALISGHSDSADIAKRINDDYNAADSLLKNGKYDEANVAFLALYNYSDSRTKAQESLYQKAETLQAAGALDDAINVYSGLGEYKDSKERISACKYNKAESLLANKDYDGSIALFESISNYRDSMDRAKVLRYEKANTLWDEGNLQEARAEYETLGDYSDAPERLTKVLTEIADNALANKDYVSALSAYQGLGQTAEIQKREYELAQLCYDAGHYEEAVSAYEILGQYELSLSKLPIARYAWADQLFTEGKYAKAAEQFALLGDMTDSATRANESVYQLANDYLENKDYDVAKSYYSSISGYNDADVMCKECDYREATDLLNSGKYEDAEKLFRALGGYSDSKTQLVYCIYNRAEALFGNGDYEEANRLYVTISYRDSATKAQQCVYNIAEALFDAKDYEGAKSKFASIDYLDSKERAKESVYQKANALYYEKKYADAENVFRSIAGYNDSSERAKECHLQQGKDRMNTGDFKGALVFFESLEYADSAELAARCHYELGRALHLSGNTDAAVAEYAFAVSLPETSEVLVSMAKDYIVINEHEKAIQTLWLINDLEEAKTMLIEIGAEKQESNAPLALLAFSATGDSNLLELNNLIENVSYKSFEAAIDSCDLLPAETNCTNSILYTYGLSALEAERYDDATNAFNAARGYNEAEELSKHSQYLKGVSLFNEQKYDDAMIIFKALGAYKDSNTQVNECLYQKALQLFDDELYNEAATVFASIAEHKDSTTKGKESLYQLGLKMMSNKQYDEAINVFSSLEKYSDSTNKVKECNYIKGQAAYSAKKYDEAFKIFSTIKGYKDSNAMSKKARVRTIWEVVTFGHYEQDGKSSNGAESIEWIVIDVAGNKAMLLSKYVLDCQPYNTKGKAISWEKCSLRSWLNKNFLNAAFTKEEQAAILSTNVDNSKFQGDENYSWTYVDGNNTKDKIYIISYKEYIGIAQGSEYDRGIPTKYAESKGATMEYSKYGGMSSSYWLRTPPTDDHAQAYYNAHGYPFGCFVDENDIGVRPVLWVDLNSSIFN